MADGGAGPEQRAQSWMGPPVTCPLVHMVPCGAGSRSTREGDLGESLFPHPAPSPSRGSSQESPKTWTLRRCPSGAQSRQGHAQGTGGAGCLSQRSFSSIRHTSPTRADGEPLPEARHLSSCLRAKSLSPGRLFVTPWTVVPRLLRPWGSPGRSTGSSYRTLLCVPL